MAILGQTSVLLSTVSCLQHEPRSVQRKQAYIVLSPYTLPAASHLQLRGFLSYIQLNLAISGFLFYEILFPLEPMYIAVSAMSKEFMPSCSNWSKSLLLCPGGSELQLTHGVTSRQMSQKEWMGLPQLKRLKKTLFIQKN